MTLDSAVNACRESGLTGWARVSFAQSLVNQNMRYSYFNSFDFPKAAFEKGKGYCWQQAGALLLILKKLGFECRLVHAVKNRIPEKVLDSIVIKEHVSGHVWVKVRYNGIEKDVCPGYEYNKPGTIHFQPLSRVRSWNPFISFFSYFGSALVNHRRGKKFYRLVEKQKAKWNPALCPCKKTSCPRHQKCEECKAYHYEKNGLPGCER